MGFEKNPVEFPFEFFPSGLKTLIIDEDHYYNFYFIFSVKKLPRNLASIELHNTNILDFGSEDANSDYSVSWPPSLKTIKLVSCLDEESNLTQLNTIVWPESLTLLDSSKNEFPSLSFLTNLPHSLDELHLNDCKFFEFGSAQESIERIRFPKCLKKLYMEGCKIESLNRVEFPASLKVLCLSFNYIEDLREYEGENISWANLVNLETLDLGFNSICNLSDWYPPPNVEYLGLSYNNLEKIISDWPIFNGSQNMKYSSLRTLGLAGFHISYIDDRVSVPPNLIRLNLRFNKGLDSVPIPSKLFTHSLRELYWGDARIRHLGVQDPYFNEVIEPYSIFSDGPHFDY